VCDFRCIPTLTTLSATNITEYSVTLGGSISNVGNPPYTERGVCWSTSENPTTSNSKKQVSGSGIGDYTTSVTGLEVEKTYYVRAYAINTEGTAYGNQVSYTIGGNTVVINGIRWATCNVDAPGTFAAKPEDAGMFYQWNRKIGWSSKDPMVSSNGGTIWDDSTPSGSIWEKANDPSPAGYRVPTQAEIQKLLDTNKVNSVWTILNGVSGRRFTDRASGSSIFLPAAGYRGGSNGTLNFVGTNGDYWCSTQYSAGNAYYLGFFSGDTYLSSSSKTVGFAVRPVAE